MSEFLLPYGTPDAALRFIKLSPFIRGYVEAMFFTECHSDNLELEDATVHDIAPETWDRIIADCDAFEAKYLKLLNFIEDRNPDYDRERMGNDFWYTRNGHGVGFWVRGLGRAGDLLSKACGWHTAFPEVGIYRGDDGLIYMCEG